REEVGGHLAVMRVRHAIGRALDGASRRKEAQDQRRADHRKDQHAHEQLDQRDAVISALHGPATTTSSDWKTSRLVSDDVSCRSTRAIFGVESKQVVEGANAGMVTPSQVNMTGGSAEKVPIEKSAGRYLVALSESIEYGLDPKPQSSSGEARPLAFMASAQSRSTTSACASCR